MFQDLACIWDLKATLGEGMLWIAAEQALYLVDITGRQLHRIVPATGERRSWDAPARPTFLVPMQGGGLLCGHEDGLRRFDPATGRFGALHPVEPLLPDNRLNDACADDRGRLWFGTMHDPESQASGTLYRLDGLDRTPEAMDGGYVVSNGPAIDTVRRRLYHNDTALRIIYVFELDDDGRVSGRREFARTTNGHPDGMTVDSEGSLWVALYGGGGVQRYDPAGNITGFVPLPASAITKIAFGDDDLRTAYVSSARGRTPGADQKLAGGVFRFRVDVPGLLPASFG